MIFSIFYVFYKYFNSIKVQLKLIDFFSIDAFKAFQFHKGTIKTFTSSTSFPALRISIP